MLSWFKSFIYLTIIGWGWAWYHELSKPRSVFPEPTCLLVSTKTRSSGIINFQRSTRILELPASRRMRGLVYMASRDKVDVDMFYKGIQYALERLGKSQFGFKSKSHEGSGNELVETVACWLFQSSVSWCWPKGTWALGTRLLRALMTQTRAQ